MVPPAGVRKGLESLPTVPHTTRRSVTLTTADELVAAIASGTCEVGGNPEAETTRSSEFVKYMYEDESGGRAIDNEPAKVPMSPLLRWKRPEATWTRREVLGVSAGVTQSPPIGARASRASALALSGTFHSRSAGPGLASLALVV
jgi:hypothetical protein